MSQGSSDELVPHSLLPVQGIAESVGTTEPERSLRKKRKPTLVHDAIARVVENPTFVAAPPVPGTVTEEEKAENVKRRKKECSAKHRAEAKAKMESLKAEVTLLKKENEGLRSCMAGPLERISILEGALQSIRHEKEALESQLQTAWERIDASETEFERQGIVAQTLSQLVDVLENIIQKHAEIALAKERDESEQNVIRMECDLRILDLAREQHVRYLQELRIGQGGAF
jgi:septal ring factor EnvC (AmiA/AmiB activator)